MNQAQQGKKPLLTLLAVLASLFLIAAACGSDSADGDDGDDSGEDGGDGEGRIINVAIVENGNMEDIAELTPELFTAETGIEVNYTLLDEATIRQLVTREVGGGETDEEGNFDVVMVGLYDTPQFAATGGITPLDSFFEGDDEWNVDDITSSVRDGLTFDDELYAAPFYAESSFIMYRADVLEEAGLEFSENPTWQEVAEIAQAIDTDERAGICLRGQPGWGNLGASFTTVLNTFGGTWWEANEDGTPGAAQVDQPEFREALEFYIDLLDTAGQDDPTSVNFPECLSLYQNDQVAMWYDATVAAGFVQTEGAGAGVSAFAPAPVVDTDSSGWLWSWNLAIPEATEDKDTAWEFVRWATSSEYLEAAGQDERVGWATVPPGARVSLYENEDYLAAADTFASATLASLEAADPVNPGTTDRPGLGGVQFVGIPEWQDIGNRCTERLADAIAGEDIDAAIADCQEIASEVSQ